MLQYIDSTRFNPATAAARTTDMKQVALAALHEKLDGYVAGSPEWLTTLDGLQTAGQVADDTVRSYLQEEYGKSAHLKYRELLADLGLWPRNHLGKPVNVKDIGTRAEYIARARCFECMRKNADSIKKKEKDAQAAAKLALASPAEKANLEAAAAAAATKAARQTIGKAAALLPVLGGRSVEQRIFDTLQAAAAAVQAAASAGVLDTAKEQAAIASIQLTELETALRLLFPAKEA